MALLLDMDGVIADYHSAVMKAFGIQVDKFEHPPGHYKMNELLTLTDEEYDEHLGKIKNFWFNIEPTKEMEQIVRLVETYDKEYLVCTKPSVNYHCASQKVQWIRKYLGHNRFIITRHKYKLSRATHLALIDDDGKNVAPWGERGFLYPRQWNKNHEYQDQALPMLDTWLRTLSEEVVTK